MKITFEVELLQFETIQELPHAWTDQNFKELLEELNIDDAARIPAPELKEMCLMALTDHAPEDAAKVVLGYLFKDQLTPGQIDNISVEMLDEKMWEEYADLAMHEMFFNAAQLLRVAFDGSFPLPEAVQFQVKVRAKNNEILPIFESDPEVPLIRLLTRGMPDSTLIYRLFDDQLKDGPFEEAKDIIWQIEKKAGEKSDTITFEVISSQYWFHDFEEAGNFQAELLFEDD